MTSRSTSAPVPAACERIRLACSCRRRSESDERGREGPEAGGDAVVRVRISREASITRRVSATRASASASIWTGASWRTTATTSAGDSGAAPTSTGASSVMFRFHTRGVDGDTRFVRCCVCDPRQECGLPRSRAAGPGGREHPPYPQLPRRTPGSCGGIRDRARARPAALHGLSPPHHAGRRTASCCISVRSRDGVWAPRRSSWPAATPASSRSPDSAGR